MDFDRRIKGNITESLAQTLLEHAGYRVVPLGVEHVIREVKERNLSSRALPLGLRTLPDMFVTNATREYHWLLEVKFRQCWNKTTVTELEDTVEEQVKHWDKIYLLVFLGEHHGPTQTPASQCRVFVLTHENGELHYLKDNQPRPWPDVNWKHGHRIQDVFAELKNTREEDGIRKCCNLIRQYNSVLAI